MIKQRGCSVVGGVSALINQARNHSNGTYDLVNDNKKEKNNNVSRKVTGGDEIYNINNYKNTDNNINNKNDYEYGYDNYDNDDIISEQSFIKNVKIPQDNDVDEYEKENESNQQEEELVEDYQTQHNDGAGDDDDDKTKYNHDPSEETNDNEEDIRTEAEHTIIEHTNTHPSPSEIEIETMNKIERLETLMHEQTSYMEQLIMLMESLKQDVVELKLTIATTTVKQPATRTRASTRKKKQNTSIACEPELDLKQDHPIAPNKYGLNLRCEYKEIEEKPVTKSTIATTSSTMEEEEMQEKEKEKPKRKPPVKKMPETKYIFKVAAKPTKSTSTTTTTTTPDPQASDKNSVSNDSDCD